MLHMGTQLICVTNQCTGAAITCNGLFVSMPSEWPQSCCSICVDTEVVLIINYIVVHIQALLIATSMRNRIKRTQMQLATFLPARVLVYRVEVNAVPSIHRSAFHFMTWLLLISQEPEQKCWVKRVQRWGQARLI